MTAIQYGLPVKRTLSCTNPVCHNDAVFMCHRRDGTQAAICIEHVNQYLLPGSRLIRLTDGVPDPTEVLDSTGQPAIET